MASFLRRGRRSFYLASFAALFLWPLTAYAGQMVSIELTGEIQPECQLAAMPSQLDMGQLTTSGSFTIPFTLNCNAPFGYRVHAQEGGLKYSGAYNLPAEFLDTIPYMLEVNIPTDAGLISDQCESESLAGEAPQCHFSSSGSGVAINQPSSLKISWLTNADLGAGVYREVLTFTVSPQF